MNEVPQELYKILFITSASFSVWTILNILINKKPFNDLHKTIIFYLVVLTFPPINAYCRIVFDEPTIWLQNVAYNLTWLYGPLILLIVKQVFLYPISDKILAIHLVLPFFVLIDRVSGTFFTENYILFFYLLMFQTFIYLSYSSYVCIKNKSKLKQLFKGHKNTTYYWMMFLIIGLFVLNFMDLIIINDLIAGKASNMDAMSAIAGLVSLYVSLISTLAIFQTDNFQLQIIDTSDDTLEETEKPKVRNIELSTNAVNELDEKLTNLVKDIKPHLDADISLDKLSSMMGVSRGQLSEFFNVHKEISFYEYLNELRFKESLRLLECSKDANSISDIAYQAGFNNRNTFYKVFKKNVGQTPTEYRKNLSASHTVSVQRVGS